MKLWGCLLLSTGVLHAQVAIAEISGSHGDAQFHGYAAFIDYSAKPKIEPVVIRPKPVTACGQRCEKPSAPLVTTYEFAQAAGTFLAVNGSFSNSAKAYDVCGCLRVWGPVKSAGKLLFDPAERADDDGNPALLFGRDGRPRIAMIKPAELKAARDVVSGEWKDVNAKTPAKPGTLLIQNSVSMGSSALPVPDELAPRTAVGLTGDGVLIVVVIEGRLPGFSAGITLPNLASLMASFGARDAVNLDGGGSTAMIYRPLGTPVVETKKLDDILHSKPGGDLKFKLQQRNPLEAFSSRPCDARPNDLYRPTTIHWGLRAKR